MADSYGFDVYLANSPLHEDLPLDSNFQVYFSDMRSALSELVSQSPRENLLMDQIVTFDDARMQNTDHVTYDGAQIYTQWLFDNMSSESLP